MSITVDKLSELFGTNFTPTDKVFVVQIEEDMKQDKDVIKPAFLSTCFQQVIGGERNATLTGYFPISLFYAF